MAYILRLPYNGKLRSPRDGSDRNFYDRYFFNGYSPDLSLFFAAALGVYPQLDVVDAAFCLLVDGRQHNVRASRRLDALGARAEGEQVWRAYRLYAFSGVLMAVFASTNVEPTARGGEMFAVMTERPARQAIHLDSLSLL